MTTLNKLLIAAVAVQLGLALLVRRGGDGQRIGQPEPLLAGFDAGEVEGRELFDDPGEAGQPDLILERRDGSWRLASHFDYPAKAETVDELLGKLGAMTSRGPIASGSARAAQLGVAADDYQRRIRLVSGEQTVELYLGKPAGGRRHAVRIGDAEQIHAVAAVSPWAADPKPSRWIEPSYFGADKEQVTELGIARDGANYQLTRGDDGWQRTGAGDQPVAVNSQVMDRLLDQLTDIAIAEPADPKRELTSPLATVRLLAGDGPERTLEIGEAEGDRYYVRESGSETAALVRKSELDAVIDLDDQSLAPSKS